MEIAVTAEPIRVAIVEDDRATREGLALLIDGTPGYACRRTFRSVEEALRADGPSPDVLLLDIHLPGMPGSAGVRALQEKHPGAVILMLTVYEGQDLVFESLCNGASGYLLKKTVPARLLEAIREAREGGSPMSPEIARKVIGLFRSTAAPVAVAHALTAREVELLQLLAQGHSYQACAERLHLSINTVRNHIRSTYEKLHVHSSTEAVTKALKGRLIC
ncbi:MAG TPA: response regulator transcription factor [Thermoanaerobaculia bacterium]|nr:response regulator transcription factor [Thermoanaerobaculia bacterium]